MDFVLPKLIASLAAISIIFLVYLQLCSLHRDRFIISWTIAWGMFLARNILTFWLKNTLAPHAVNTLYGLLGPAAIYFLYRGNCLFVGKSIAKWPLWLMIGGILCSAATWVSGLPFWLKMLPYSFSMASVIVLCGLLILRAGKMETLSQHVVGYSFVFWGLCQTTPPFVADKPGTIMWGLFVVGALEVWTAISLLVLFFQKNRRDLIEAQRQLELAKEEAEAASQAKTEFLAKVNHDLRSPLFAISNFLELAREPGDDCQVAYCVEMAQKATRVMAELVEDLLDFSSIESGKLRLANKPFRLGEVLDEVFANLLPRAREKSLELVKQVSSQVPDQLVGDRAKLRQVILNLAGNAVKFTPHGEVVISVDLEGGSARELMLHFCVADTGPGVPEDEREKIFVSFYQVKGEGYSEGVGLGLAIAKEIVSGMGGEIWVADRKPVGSEFHFTARFGRLPG